MSKQFISNLLHMVAAVREIRKMLRKKNWSGNEGVVREIQSSSGKNKMWANM